MEYPTPGLDLHLNLGVRGADGHMAYRTTPARSSSDPSLRNGLRQGPTLNLSHDGLIETAHRSLLLAWMVWAGRGQGHVDVALAVTWAETYGKTQTISWVKSR